MSNRSKNLLATVAMIGIAAIASSRGLAPNTPAPQQQIAPASSPLVLASLSR
jgi:hypothetical protein